MNAVEFIEKIKAMDRAGKYSKNLYLWIKKQIRRRLQLDIVVAFSKHDADAAHISFSYEKSLSGLLYIGHMFDDGWMHGSRLSTVTCEGSRTASFAFGPNFGMQIIPDWWEHYISLGKCCIDPEHYFYADSERWEANGGSLRACNWCGLVQRKRCWIEPVERETWETIEAGKGVAA